MTTRERLRLRGGCTTIGLAAYLLGLGWLMSAQPFGFITRFVLAVFSLAIVAAAFWNLFEVPCAACAKPLGYFGFKVATGASSGAHESCPHCERPLDEAP